MRLTFGKLFLSFLITNWIYSELVLFFPEFGVFAHKFVDAVSIPTHDEWGDIVSSGNSMLLARKAETSFSEEGIGRWLQNVGIADPAMAREYALRNQNDSSLFASPKREESFVTVHEIGNDFEGEGVLF